MNQTIARTKPNAPVAPVAIAPSLEQIIASIPKDSATSKDIALGGMLRI